MECERCVPGAHDLGLTSSTRIFLQFAVNAWKFVTRGFFNALKPNIIFKNASDVPGAPGAAVDLIYENIFTIHAEMR